MRVSFFLGITQLESKLAVRKLEYHSLIRTKATVFEVLQADMHYESGQGSFNNKKRPSKDKSDNSITK